LGKEGRFITFLKKAIAENGTGKNHWIFTTGYTDYVHQEVLV